MTNSIMNLGIYAKKGFKHPKWLKKKRSIALKRAYQEGRCHPPSTIGKKFSDEHKRKISIAHKGKKLSNEHLESLSKSHKDKPRPWARGKNSPNWKGGISPINKRIRKSLKFKLWREAIFERDNYICLQCGIRNKKGNGETVVLHPHHIKPFYSYPKLRFDVNNGETLCENCHKRTETWGRPTMGLDKFGIPKFARDRNKNAV